jgi:Tol biopolymer transport system component/predicted Ser/Thr protein kinase
MMEKESLQPGDEASGPELSAGDSIGRYKLLSKLGSGGMGEVFTAEDPDLNREIAIKVLPGSMAANEGLVRRFEREAQAIAKLEHPNIVTIYSVERVDDVEFITMQLVDGETLRVPIKAGGSPPYEFFDLAIQMADAVGSAHERGIIHRDIKPENILVTPDGRVMILDFGLAKLRAEVEPRGVTEAPSHLTSDGMVVGTMDYMSPEQAEGREVDHRSDIFSLGIVLFELATGEHPFKGESNLSVISSIMKDPARSALEVKPDLPRQLDRILQLALEKNREQRTQSMKDLRNQLESLKRETSTTPRSLGVRRKLPLGVMLSSFVVGAALALGAGLALMNHDQSTGRTVQLGTIRRITGGEAAELQPAISPSGKMIAYARGPMGQQKLYVKHVAGGKPVALTVQYEGCHLWPQWSPDESQIAFEVDNQRWLISPFPSDRRSFEGADGLGGLTWSGDGRRVVYAREGSLYLRDSQGGEEVLLVTAHEPCAPSWSPDGTRIAYVSDNNAYNFAPYAMGNIAPSSIWLVASTGGEPKEIVSSGALNVCPQWLDDDHLIFISDRHGRNDLYVVRFDGSGAPVGVAERITTGLNADSFTLSADRTKITFCEATKSSNIWRLPIPEAGQTASVRDAMQVTFGSQVIEGMDVSTNEEWIVFDSNRGGNQDIYRASLPDGEQQQLTIEPADEFIPNISPRDDWITFHSFVNGNRDIFVMASEGTGMIQVTSKESADRYGNWSPDGNQLVFHSDRSGVTELWLTTRSGPDGPWSDPRQLTSSGGGSPDWSPDGELITFSNAQGCWVVRPDGSGLRSIASQGRILVASADPQWSTGGERIYFLAWSEEGPPCIWSVGLEGNEPRAVVTFDDPRRPPGRPEIAVGDGYLYFTVAERRMDIFTIDVEFMPRH